MKQLIVKPQTSLSAGLIVGSMVCTAAVSFATEGNWIRKADMPTPRFASSIAEVDGKLFVIGGSQSSTRLSTVEMYDPAMDTWTPKAPMPTARKNTAAAVVNGKIYVFGGTQVQQGGSIRTTEAYDVATDTWTTKRDMPTARLGLGAVPVNGKIYAIEGYGGPFESVVEVYDPVTDTWEQKTRGPFPNGDFAFATLNGKIYTFGGASFAGVRNDTVEYDPATDQWTTKANMPTGRFFPSASVLAGEIYVMGGNLRDSPYPATARVELYDPVANTWEAGVPMPTARSGLVSATVNGTIYAIGGHTGVSFLSPGTIYATVEAFSLPLEFQSVTRSGNNLNLSWTGGTPPYQVRTSSSLGAESWTNVGGTTTQTSATVNLADLRGFFRVSGQ